ncbi:MAG: HEAT repeat domain-containing protein [Gammaproteobacteria bacterium]|jgi:HEAT repeat protein
MDFVSDYVTASDTIVVAAIYISIISAFLILSLSVWVSVLRLRLTMRNRRRRKIRNLWNPVLTRITVGENPPIPPFSYRDSYAFLIEWNDFYSIVRGNSLDQLRRLAEKLRIDYYSRRMLFSRRLHDQLLAAITLGHMREYSAWDELYKLVFSDQNLLAITAARALLLIDPDNASKRILPLLLASKQWPWSNVADALRLAGPANVCTPLAELANVGSPEEQIRLLRFMEVVRCEIVTDAITNILAASDDDRVTSVCLSIVRDTSALPHVYKHLDNTRWHVRMQAAAALGRIGNKNDIPRLLEKLADREWWVRYRSAQAIARLCGDKPERLLQLREQLDDAYGRDMLTHVIAEIQHQL